MTWITHDPETALLLSHHDIFQKANENMNIWSTLMWISGGNLNNSKCFYYYSEPYFDLNNTQKKYKSSSQSPGQKLLNDPSTQKYSSLTRLEIHEARWTHNRKSHGQIQCSIQKLKIFLEKFQQMPHIPIPPVESNKINT
jgi:hypothetical protein